VRAAVVGTPTGALDGLWWHELMAGVPALVIETAALPRAAQVALGRVGRPPEGPFSIPAA